MYPTYDQMDDFYGPAGGPDCTAGIVNLPISFKLAWDTSKNITSFRCHKKLQTPFKAIFDQAVRHYGETKFRELRLDLFGGCFNHRMMRNGTRLSTHSWGAAVDLDPERNQLRWGRDRASLAKPEYEAFWKIVEKQGAVSLGRQRNVDWMHFQFSRL